MDQEQLKVFIENTIRYFNKITGIPIEVGVPHLKEEDKSILLNYTGAIGISGKMKGAIYITAEKGFLSDLVARIMGIAEVSGKQMSSMAGELANTIAGNAQQAFGSDFLISIPMIITSENADSGSSLALQIPTFVIPLRWNGHQALLAIGLKAEG
jgi:chemotaxis protein CheX